MEIALVFAIGAMNILCFLIGARVGQQVRNGEEVKVPSVNPTEIYREHQEKKEARQEREIRDTIMQNIDSYDGTGYGQLDIPKR